MFAPIIGLVLLTGFVFMVLWAARFATKHQLTSAISWFLAIGIIGTLLGGAFGTPLRRMMGGRFGSAMMGGALRYADDDRGWFGCPYVQDAQASSAASPTKRK